MRGGEKRWLREKRGKCEREESEGFERGGRMGQVGKIRGGRGRDGLGWERMVEGERVGGEW